MITDHCYVSQSQASLNWYLKEKSMTENKHHKIIYNYWYVPNSPFFNLFYLFYFIFRVIVKYNYELHKVR